MVNIKSLVVGATSLLPLVAAATPAKTYSLCQKKTPSPLEGCPRCTLYVSQNDTKAHFTSIQEAINSLPNTTTPRYILIGAGVYYEQLNVTRQGPLTLLGQSDSPWKGTSLSGEVDYNNTVHNDVTIYHNAPNSGVFSDNVFSGVITIGPNLDTTKTGSGPTGWPVPADAPFGCSDFRAYNIDFRNELYPRSFGPAHAMGAGYANAGFYSCGFYSYQDTIYVGKKANVIMYDSIIAGQTDFLYGFGTLYVSKSSLLLRNCGGGVTAWKGTNTTFDNKYGVYVSESRIVAENTTVLAEKNKQCSLGRPWNSLHRSVIMETYLDGAILPAGYTKWSGQVNGNYGINTTMAVYKTYGPGNDPAAQLASNVTVIFNRTQVEPYDKPADVFSTPGGAPLGVAWVDPVALLP